MTTLLLERTSRLQLLMAVAVINWSLMKLPNRPVELSTVPEQHDLFQPTDLMNLEGLDDVCLDTVPRFHTPNP